MKDLLLEIGTEELPARFVPLGLEQLAAGAARAFAASGLGSASMFTWGTPRRLVLWAGEVSDQTSDRRQEALGPGVAQAKDPGGNWTPAAQGFARSQGIPVDSLEIRETDRGPRLAAVRLTPGQNADKILPELLSELIRSLSFPKSMVWEESRLAFGRPIRWLVALHGSRVLPIAVAGVKSGRRTMGLRFQSKPFDVAAPGRYVELLRNHCVVVDPAERRVLVVKQVEQAVKPAHGIVPLDRLADLLDEVVNLVEHPVAILGHFDPAHLSLPPEVLVTSMKKHQKFFPVFRADGALLPHFVGVRNGLSDGQSVVREGYERVLAARLADAAFFFREDLKRPLADRVKDLQGIAFLSPKLSLLEKTKRVQKLVSWMAGSIHVEGPALDDAVGAAHLAKADLTTGMVGEFPELQGVMGRIYGAQQGLGPAVATAIEEHYWPLTAEGELPPSIPGSLVAWADRLDTLAGNFLIGKVPSGSQDPYGLRRAAVGLLRIMEARGWDIPLGISVAMALQGFPAELGDPERAKASLLDFLRQRWVALHETRGVRVDYLRAVTGAGFDQPLDAAKRLAALQAYQSREGFDAVAGLVKRAKNIVVQAEKKFGPVVRGALALQEGPEKPLFDAVAQARSRTETEAERGNYGAVLENLHKLRNPLDQYFKDVLVMAPEAEVRNRRVAVLQDFTSLFQTMWDFTQLQDTV